MKAELMEPMRRRPSSRLLVIDRNGRVLLFRFVYHRGPLAGQNYWATPGGALEAGESFADAARRELFKETGILTDTVGQPVAEREFTLQLLDGSGAREDAGYVAGRLRRRADQIGCVPHKAIPAIRTPNITNVGRAERSRESACHSAAAPIINMNEASQAAASAAFRDSLVIHAFAKAPIRGENQRKSRHADKCLRCRYKHGSHKECARVVHTARRKCLVQTRLRTRFESEI